jgi:hypothetical protein
VHAREQHPPRGPVRAPPPNPTAAPRPAPPRSRQARFTHALREQLGISHLLVVVDRRPAQLLRHHLDRPGERDLTVEERQGRTAREEVDGRMHVFVVHCVLDFCVQNCADESHSGKPEGAYMGILGSTTCDAAAVVRLSAPDSHCATSLSRPYCSRYQPRPLVNDDTHALNQSNIHILRPPLATNLHLLGPIHARRCELKQLHSARSTVSSAIALYVVHLPPVIVTSPPEVAMPTWLRTSLGAPSPFSRTTGGRRPAHVLTTSCSPARARRRSPSRPTSPGRAGPSSAGCNSWRTSRATLPMRALVACVFRRRMGRVGKVHWYGLVAFLAPRARTVLRPSSCPTQWCR